MLSAICATRENKVCRSLTDGRGSASTSCSRGAMRRTSRLWASTSSTRCHHPFGEALSGRLGEDSGVYEVLSCRFYQVMRSALGTFGAYRTGVSDHVLTALVLSGWLVQKVTSA